MDTQKTSIKVNEDQINKRGIYSEYMSREYKEAWNKISWEKCGIIMFKDLDSGESENITKTKL